MSDVYVAGAAMTGFGRFPQSSIRSLAEEAVSEALADAGIGPQHVQMAAFANAAGGVLSGQEMIRGQTALRHTGLLGIPILNVENACASGSSAVHLAWLAIRAGACDVALAVGVEKLTHEDRSRPFAALAAALDQSQAEELTRELRPSLRRRKGASASSPPEQVAAGDGERSIFMDVYAAEARTYMESSGATIEDLARVVVKSHHHALSNPKAQYRQEVTVEEVLASREIAAPLTLLMCSRISDGAAALVLCSEGFAQRHGRTTVRLRTSALVSGRDRRPHEATAVERAAALAYEQVGIGPDDVDVVELQDAAAPAELITYEELGLCPADEGPALLASGATAVGGRMPVNPSGGLLSKGDPMGASGCAQLVELVDQLRGRCGPRQIAGARIALAENAGGYLGNDPAAAVVTILSR
jgi:acetyl-CoA acyltransferase